MWTGLKTCSDTRLGWTTPRSIKLFASFKMAYFDDRGRHPKLVAVELWNCFTTSKSLTMPLNSGTKKLVNLESELDITEKPWSYLK
jgi:hypothetical protein